MLLKGKYLDRLLVRFQKTCSKHKMLQINQGSAFIWDEIKVRHLTKLMARVVSSEFRESHYSRPADTTRSHWILILWSPGSPEQKTIRQVLGVQHKKQEANIIDMRLLQQHAQIQCFLLLHTKYRMWPNLSLTGLHWFVAMFGMIFMCIIRFIWICCSARYSYVEDFTNSHKSSLSLSFLIIQAVFGIDVGKVSLLIFSSQALSN